MNKILSYIAVMATALFALTGCSDSSDDPQPALPVKPEISRAVLVYMVADNNLSRYAALDLKEMASVAAKECEENNARWIVYYSGPDQNPRLIEFNAEGNETILKQYPADVKSVTIERMRDVISDFRQITHANQTGIVLWSHGTGWIDDRGSIDEPSDKDMIDPQSYGYDGYNGAKMKVTSLARALTGWDLDFIYFDCCHMATVEVAYELRHAANTMVACPTELGVEGMPYDKNIGPLLRGDVTQAAQNTFDYYQSHYNVSADAVMGYCIYGCAITVVDLSKMDRLAQTTHAIMTSGASLPDGYSPVKYFRNGVTDGIYDISHYINSYPANAELLAQWNDSYSDAIISSHHTPKVYFLDATNFSGLGCNIILSADQASYGGFDSYQWWKDVVAASFE